jgi:hypothetical protein
MFRMLILVKVNEEGPCCVRVLRIRAGLTVCKLVLISYEVSM